MAKKKSVAVIEKTAPEAAGVAGAKSKKPSISDVQLAGLADLTPDFEGPLPRATDCHGGSEDVLKSEIVEVDRVSALAGLIDVASMLVDSFIPGYGLVESEVAILANAADPVIEKYSESMVIGPEAALFGAVAIIVGPRVARYRQEVRNLSDQSNAEADDGGKSKSEATE